MIRLNGETLAFETYPNGETRMDGDRILALARTEGGNRIAFKYGTDADLIKLMFVKSYLDDRCLGTAALDVYYMPYSRMDRAEGASAFTLKYAARMINAMNFERVTVVEPHSDVTLALLDRSRAIYPTLELLGRVTAETGFDPSADYLFFPDAGAQKRYGRVEGFKQLVGHKERDFRTGRIQKLDVAGGVDREGFQAIIVDDLCSYGGTFLLSAERLRELGAARIYLLATHCENAIYQGKLPASGLIDRVYTTDTILDGPGTDFITIYPIGGMLP
ncbi:ribose-phosphate pyrophosphokinase [Cohnella sp. JJ-181]|uniref:ribose-phosphate pyrophosphokinase n=1 Tax=Cohnella rhizoplanae TaxID=2974897 RepID=UPI0022FFA6DA|nr:ribose-phosphate pyrophosphokinase [Cohnella sp. JJ-181]CAI6074539.1 Putative ribose-phosphate pyrophosphokinase [Cohnella sp. JJ-181]